MALTAKAQIGIQKPISEVFEAIVNPEIMQNYFISKGSGRLELGKVVTWEFAEMEEGFPVQVTHLRTNKFIEFNWDPNSKVEISLKSRNPQETIVCVSEMGYQNDEKGLNWVIQQTEGWANFLACMKAWLEYGIHLRKGAFDFMI